MTPPPARNCPLHGTLMRRVGLLYYCDACAASSPEVHVIPPPSPDDLQRVAIRDYDTPQNIVAYGAWIRRAVAAERACDELRKLNESLAARVASQSELLTKRAEKVKQ